MTLVLAGGTAGVRHAGLTRLRAVLIGWVVLYHLDLLLNVSGAWPWAASLLQHGYLGVDGFFLLSGFALWLGYGDDPPRDGASVRRFWQRRFARTWPLHAVVLLALGLLVAAVTVADVTINDPGRFELRDYALQFTLLNGWETTDRHAWNSLSWALSVEWAGYLAFPLLVHGIRRLPAAALPALVGLALAGLGALGAGQAGLNLTLHLGLARFGLEFILGLALGRLATLGRLPVRALPWIVAAAVSVGLLLRLDVVVAAGLAALVPSLFLCSAPGRETGLLHRLGEASFGIYICYVFVEAAMVGGLRLLPLGPAGRLLGMLVGLGLAAGVGVLAWRWVELPLQRWVLGWGGRRSSGGRFKPMADDHTGRARIP
jgi:peptidoglycan/LPS O-acetylase OafA/YrhL